MNVERTCSTAAPRGAVVLIHGFAQNCRAWDLPGRSFPRFLAAEGWDVFNVELPPARRLQRHVERDLPHVLEQVGGPVFLIGHSLGGAVAYAVAANQPERVRGVVTLSGVYRWGNAGRWMQRMIGVVQTSARAGRALRLRTPNIRLDVLGRALAARLTRDDRLPVPIQGWYPGSIEPEILDQWLRLSLHRTSGSVLSQMADWAKRGEMDYAERWRACRVPVLVIAADRDRLAHPRKDVRPAYDASTSHDRTYRCFGRNADNCPFGHVDLIMGRQAPRLVWPYIASWLGERDV